MCPGFPSQPSQEYDKNGSGTRAEKNNPTQQELPELAMDQLLNPEFWVSVPEKLAILAVSCPVLALCQVSTCYTPSPLVLKALLRGWDYCSPHFRRGGNWERLATFTQLSARARV